jgi:hypothetical protein
MALHYPAAAGGTWEKAQKIQRRLLPAGSVAPRARGLCSGEGVRLVQLDRVARRILEKRLQTPADTHRIPDLEASLPQLGDSRRQVLDEDGKVLAEVGRWLGLDEVDLLVAGVEPCSAKTEVGPIGPQAKTEHLGVEGDRGGNVADVDGDMMDGESGHALILARQRRRRRRRQGRR